MSAALTHLSLSLSLSCPSSTPDLTADFGRFAAPFVGRINCCHACDDVRCPRNGASDGNSAYTHAKVRQAHCEWTCRAPGGVAESHRAWHISTDRKCPSSTPGLAGKDSRFSSLVAGYGKPRPQTLCSKLPCHAHEDVHRPYEVTRDRNSTYTHAKVRQAHCEWTCRAPGGVA